MTLGLVVIGLLLVLCFYITFVWIFDCLLVGCVMLVFVALTVVFCLI